MLTNVMPFPYYNNLVDHHDIILSMNYVELVAVM